ncbi:MAG: nuclear transport factor 2 family protein [Armatimonadetes bacterium]|nr:nuclear transport factor 2 family protein [Armatimonadota bacterium]
MRKLVTIFTAVAVCASAMAFDESADFGKFLKGFMPKLEKAFAKMDVKFFEDWTTDDFTETMMGRTSTKKESMANMRMQLMATKSMTAKFKVLSSKAAKGTGISMTHGVIAMFTKPTEQDKVSHKWEMEVWEKQTWAKVGNVWKLKRLEEAKPLKMKVDGKAIDPKQAMGGGG